jgi:hypothetical protein
MDTEDLSFTIPNRPMFVAIFLWSIEVSLTVACRLRVKHAVACRLGVKLQ